MSPLPPSPVVGVVGGVGSGKSALARAAARRWGLARLDGDAAGHAALRDPAVMRELRATFGDGVFRASSGGGEEVDRSAVAKRVFGETDEKRAAKAALQAVVHPIIQADLLERIAEARGAGTAAVLLDAAVLLETGWQDDCDAVLFVDCPRDERLRRVAGRGWDAAELDRREASQWPLAKKRDAADATVDNGGDLAAAVDAFGEVLADWGVRLPAPSHDLTLEPAGAA